ncbi:MAG: hypothetical protein ACJ790_12225, partial [Myxococcaceae bacterium]
MISLVAIVLAATQPSPTDFYEFTMFGSPVGFVSLSESAEGYRYTSVHLYTRGDSHEQKARSETIKLDSKGRDSKGLVPASWALWHGVPESGCIDVKDELTAFGGAQLRP